MVEYPLNEPIIAPMSFGQVRYRPGDKALTVRLASGGSSTTVPIPFLSDSGSSGGGPGAARVLVDDFDFDGVPDLINGACVVRQWRRELVLRALSL